MIPPEFPPVSAHGIKHNSTTRDCNNIYGYNIGIYEKKN